jgi:hypothetical protein
MSVNPSQAKLDIEARKLELEEARVFRQHNEEYEVLRQVLVQQPRRAATQAAIDVVNADIERITVEGKRTAALMQVSWDVMRLQCVSVCLVLRRGRCGRYTDSLGVDCWGG